MRVDKGLEFFGAIKMFNVRSVSLDVKIELYKRVVVPIEEKPWGY